MKRMINKLKEFPVDQVKEIAISMANDFSQPENDTIFQAALGALENMMEETEFIMFCDSI